MVLQKGQNSQFDLQIHKNNPNYIRKTNFECPYIRVQIYGSLTSFSVFRSINIRISLFGEYINRL